MGMPGKETKRRTTEYNSNYKLAAFNNYPSTLSPSLSLSLSQTHTQSASKPIQILTNVIPSSSGRLSKPPLSNVMKLASENGFSWITFCKLMIRQ